jgi:hypothetical protein
VNNVYPSIEELMPSILLTKIPASLADEIRTRYETLGEKYLTPNVHSDGRFVNAMMYTSRVANCLEEIVDSVFCVLGWIFKAQVDGRRIPDSAFACLDMLIDIYSLLSAELEIDLAMSGGKVNV